MAVKKENIRDDFCLTEIMMEVNDYLRLYLGSGYNYGLHFAFFQG
jgi:hypothetical protein